MKELPILEQATKVQPSLGGGNFGAPAAQSAQADLQIANFGAEIAQNAATQRARLAGIEAGKNPRGQDVGVFTKTDEAYVQAYKQEALASQEFKGKQLINDMFSELSKNPTAEGLALFKNESLKAIDDYSANVPKDVQEGLRRSLEGAAMEGFYSLEGAWESRQKADRVSLWKQSTDSDTYGISNAMRTGNRDLALSIAESTYAKTIEAEKRGDVPAGTAAKTKEMVEQTLHSSQGILGLEQSAEPEKYMANLKDESWLKKLPMHAQDAVIASVVNHYNQQQAAKGAQQGINYTNYQSKIIASDMTPTDWVQAESEVSGQQFANLQQQQLKINIKDNEGYAAVAALAPYMSNASVLAGQAPSKIEAMQDYLVKNFAQQKNMAPVDLSMTDQAQALVGMAAPAKKLTNQMSAALRSGGINEAIEAAHIHQFARDLGNNELTSGLSAQDKMFSNLVKEKSKNPEFSPKDLEDLRQATYNATDEQKANGLKAVSEYKKDNSLNSFSGKMNFIKTQMKAYNFIFQDDTVLPNDIADTFDNLLDTYAVMTRDPNKASELAVRDLNDLYKETTVNGYKEKMALPPNQFIPDVGHVIENSIKMSFASYVDRLNAASNKGQVKDYNINWGNRPKEGNPLDYSSRWGDKGPITFMINGREARLIVKTDGITAASAKNEYTNYGVKMPNKNDKSWALWYEYTDTPGASYQLRDFITEKDKNGEEFTLEQGARFTPVEVDPSFKSDDEVKKIIKNLSQKNPFRRGGVNE